MVIQEKNPHTLKNIKWFIGEEMVLDNFNNQMEFCIILILMGDI
jgi:hypothetical protein